jgi:L-malate glycosyltransferase
MKICIFGDAESIHVVRWCKHFAAKGNEVHLISFKEISIEGVNSHYINVGKIQVGGGNWKVLLQFRKVKKLLHQIKPDIFHAHYATSYGIVGALCGFHPYIITTYGTDVLISGQQSVFYKLLLRYAFKKADWINTLAEHMSVAVRKIGANMSKVEVIPFGIDSSIFNSSQRVNNTSRFTITSTRNHEEIYNIPHLIKAVSKIKQSIPNLEFVIAGDGTLKNELEKLVELEDLKEITTFLGKIPQSEMVALLNRTHVFVTVSKSDGNSLSLAEAFACGAFCIATNIPANVQWIHNNENGFLVEIDNISELADKLLYCYENYDLLSRKVIEVNPKIIEEKGDWKLNMQKIESKYQLLVEKNESQ